ncbi:MAG: type II toxin-antitoxin system CcdA family antitoxin [Candidatus Methanoperedens sp.]|nr:type II toxin-antitoxin system CcdA family antitoxin [Candidatus Methanoperedens sp.]
MESEKKKLTLSINSEVIQKAKGLGINLSEITESALRLYSLGHDDEKIITPDKLREAYTDILTKILKILVKWGIEDLIIGSDGDENVYYTYMLSSGKVFLWADYLDDDEGPLQTWQLNDENLPINNFYGTEKIISKLIDKLYVKAKENKETLDKLQILKNILELSGLSK